MGWNCLAYKSYWLRDHFLLVARSDHTTGSRNIQPKVVFKVQKIAQYVSFCLIMGPLKGEVPVFARLWPIQLPWHAPRYHLTLVGLEIYPQAQLVSSLQVHNGLELRLVLELVLQPGQYGWPS